MRNFKETLEWYRRNQRTSQIGFNPDNMCLKVVRTARGIGALYPTAKRAQDATPKKHRFTRVRDLRRGMVLYYDHPRDGNTAGHVVTMIGRVKGANPDSLHDILVETNSVKRGELVVVRGDYFQKHWGDPFQFGATWLNGKELDIPNHPNKKRKGKKSVKKVAQEVINGKWGNGADRRKRLRDAGYKYVDVQKEVNRLRMKPRKGIRVIAKEVIDGKWGNGDDRTKKLRAAGYKPKQVQKEVNRLLR